MPAATTKTTDAAAVPAAANSVIQNQNNSPYKPSNPKPRVSNSAGVQTIKGGTYIGQGFFDQCQNAYTNLVNNQLALIMFVVGCLGCISLYHSTLTPIDLTHNALLTSANDTSNSYALRSISAFLAYLFNLLLTYQTMIFPMLVFGGCYVAKPSTNNAYSASLLILTCWLGSFSGIQIFAIGQLYLLFTQLRDPTYRYLIALAALVSGVLGFQHTAQLVNLAGLKAVTAGSGGTPGGGGTGGGSGGGAGGTESGPEEVLY